MANLADLPAELRSTAKRMKHIDTMPAEEARHRATYVQKLEQDSPLTGEGQKLMLAHTARLIDAIPVHEYLARIKRLSELADESPGYGLGSPSHDFMLAAAEVRAKHMYAPGLVAACENRLMGKSHGFADADIDAILAPILPETETE